MSSNLTPESAFSIAVLGGLAGLLLGGFTSLLTRTGLYPLGLVIIAFGLKFVLENAIEFRRVRHKLFARTIGVFCSVLAIGTAHYGNYQYYRHLDSVTENATNIGKVSSFSEFIYRKHSRKLRTFDLPSDFHYAASGGYETSMDFLTIFMVALFLSRMTHKPDCPECNSWLREYELGSVSGATNQIITEIIMETYSPIAKEAAIATTRLGVCFCPVCESPETFLVTVNALNTNPDTYNEEQTTRLYLTKLELTKWLKVFNKPQMLAFVDGEDYSESERSN